MEKEKYVAFPFFIFIFLQITGLHAVVIPKIV